MGLLAFLLVLGAAHASTPSETIIRNITRFSGGDLFTIPGVECGPTSCMEVSGGTALGAMGAGGCMCQCEGGTPAFREDQRTCVNNIDECPMASFGRGATKPQIPFVFLPLKGQIIYPSKEIIFTDVEKAICVVKSAQYLSNSGWVTLRDVIDNDVPFGLYRDEGKTFLQWLGSASLHSRLEGRLVAVHVLCSAQGIEHPLQAVSCAAFRVAGASHHNAFDVRSIPFHAGETITSEPSPQSQGLSVLESLAIGVCVLMLVFIYAAGIVFYIHYKQRQKRKKNKDLEMNRSESDAGSGMGSLMNMDNIRLKSNPLLDMTGDYLHDSVLSDVSEHTEDTLDSSPTNTQKFQKSTTTVTSAMIHTRKKKPSRVSLRSASSPDHMTERLSRRSASPDTFERAPHSDLSIIDCSVDTQQYSGPPANTEPTIRRKLYFNPVFFEPEHLKNPPPAAIDFLVKIREVMSIAKEKMTSKRFIPILYDIPEEELYHTIDLGWDIPCARRGRRFSAISLKRENSRRAVHCGGCPGCNNNNVREPKVALARSNSCKSCFSDDYKQKIVRKWLDEVPTPPGTHKPVKSVAKVSGTPRVIEPKEQPDSPTSLIDAVRNDRRPPTLVPEFKVSEHKKEETNKTVVVKEKPKLVAVTPINKNEAINNSSSASSSRSVERPTIQVVTKNSSNATRRIRKKLPPPPPPPTDLPPDLSKLDEPEIIPPEIKKKMEAVIQELNLCRRVEPKLLEDFKSETVAPIAPKLVIPVIAADSTYYSDDNMLHDKRKLQRHPFLHVDNSQLTKQRRFSVACATEIKNGSEIKRSPTMVDVNTKLTRSWRDLANTSEAIPFANLSDSEYQNHSLPVNGIFVNNNMEPLYDNVYKPGPLTIQIRGSPIESRKNIDTFDPDTLDRKPKREAKIRVEKIILKSSGSFKHKTTVVTEAENPISKPEIDIPSKIGSLREIYESKARSQVDSKYKGYDSRGSDVYDSDDLAVFLKSLKTPDLLRQAEIKPPIPLKQRRVSDTAFQFSGTKISPPTDRRRSPEEREKLNYLRSDLNARRSGRRSNRTRSRRTDLRKLYRTEDSGYLSTDSNESKRRAQYMMQLRSRNVLPEITQLPNIVGVARAAPALVESDTDDFESLCDGRSESGGESVETDSVFFGHFQESKKIHDDLCFVGYDHRSKLHDQIDSGFVGETIILSGDSDSEHRSVISIKAGCDGRASAASFTNLDEPPYLHTVEC